MLRASRRHKIDTLTESLIQRFSPQTLLAQIPFPIAEIIEFQLTLLCGVEFAVREDMPPEVEGCFRIERAGTREDLELALPDRVYLRLRENDRHARFVAAHELGHGVLHRAILLSLPPEGLWYSELDHGVRDDFEAEADYFAGALLLPAKAVLAFKQACPLFQTSVKAVSDFFQVTDSLAATRLTQLRKEGWF